MIMLSNLAALAAMIPELLWRARMVSRAEQHDDLVCPACFHPLDAHANGIGDGWLQCPECGVKITARYLRQVWKCWREGW